MPYDILGLAAAGNLAVAVHHPGPGVRSLLVVPVALFRKRKEEKSKVQLRICSLPTVLGVM